MKAILWTKYGPPEVLHLKEVEKPAPKDNEVLIKIRAVLVSTGDCEMRNLQFPLWVRVPMRIYVGFRKPRRVNILGGYLAGEVEVVGKDTKHFKIGDQVFGFSGMGFGGYAEYICMPEETVIPMPADLPYEEAAPVSLGGMEALHFLRMANIQPGQKLLINGAGGSIGTYAIQLAKHYGAEVTAVDSAGKLDMMRSIGADHVIDYSKEDFSKNGQKYDVILDVVLRSSFSRIMKSLNAQGIYLMTNPTLPKMIRAAWASRFTSKKVLFQFTNRSTKDLNTLKELIEAGKIKTVIDRRYSLEQVVDAHKYVETGQKKGNVVMTPG
ncbi:MAG TPA: NAD(P)-dependent alcohol dehydrogenase [Anaerolineales bacterium]|nr:NAD(P)-dependent alcohol dehydrogenase [Anaerolineales bacterium]